MRKNTFNLTYVEGLLLLTNGVTASALHRQHNVLADYNKALAEQINVTEKLSRNLDRVNQELLELKTVKTLDADFVSTKIVGTKLPHISDFTSYLDPKILAGIALAGAVYYGTPYLLAKLTLPSLKSILIPIKSAAVACLPFMKEVQLLESIKNGCTYRVVLTGDKLSGIEVRRADSHDFEPVADLLTRHFLQQDNTQSVSVNSSVSSNTPVCDNLTVQSLTDSVETTSQTVVEAFSKTPSTVDLAQTAEVTESLLNTLSVIST